MTLSINSRDISDFKEDHEDPGLEYDSHLLRRY